MSAAISTSLPVFFRDLAPAPSREYNFVRKSWAHCATENRPSKLWPDPDGRAGIARKVERADERTYFLWMADAGALALMQRSQITCAISRGTDDLVAGFVAYEPKCLHMLYVSGTFRRMGLGRTLLSLLPASLRLYSQWSPLAEKVMPRSQGWQWAPQEGQMCPHPNCPMCLAMGAGRASERALKGPR